jgi:hypothetical protein
VTCLPPYATACSTCPWRVRCQATPPDNPHAVVDPAYYADEGRRRLWANWNGTGLGARDGYRVSCHRGRGESGTPNPEPRWCAGADAVQHRALLRWWETGDLGPLTGVDAARRIAAELFDLDPIHIDERWRIGGWPVTYERLLEVVHPAVSDPAVAYENLVPPPTLDEIERWRSQRR